MSTLEAEIAFIFGCEIAPSAALPETPQAKAPKRGFSTHWTKEGRAKVTYSTHKGARAAADYLTEQNSTAMSMYKCKECAGFHVGNAPRNRRGDLLTKSQKHRRRYLANVRAREGVLVAA